MTELFSYPMHIAACHLESSPEQTLFCFQTLALALEAGRLYPNNIFYNTCRLPDWLDGQAISYHIEWTTRRRVQMCEVLLCEVLFLIHVYRDEDALAIRIGTDRLPVPEWREQWAENGAEWFHRWKGLT